MNRVAAGLVAGCLALGIPASAQAKWTRVTSAHFVFVGDASERRIREIARRLEQFRAVMGQLLPGDALTSVVPTTVVVFQDDRSFQPFKPVYQGRPVAVAGYFTGTEDANYIAVNADQDSEAYGVIFHEYAHFLIRNQLGPVPVWANEGLAQFYQTFEARDGSRTGLIGVPDRNSLRRLESAGALMPVAELMSVDTDSPLYNEGDRRELFYAESWALVHYLTFGAPQRTGQLKKYLTAIGSGVDGAEAFTAAFGTDLRALDRELDRYARSVTLTAVHVDVVPGGAGRPEPPASMTDGEAAGYLGDMLARLNRTDDARVYLRAAMRAHPEVARVATALGLLELRASNLDEAMPLLERGAQLGPDLASAQAAYGRALTQRADRGGADEDELYERARTVLGRALALEPGNVSTLVTLAEVEMGSGASPSRALALVARALDAAPGREDYRLMLAQAQALTGDFHAATVTLDLLAEHASRPELRVAAADALARVRQAELDTRGAPAQASADGAGTGASGGAADRTPASGPAAVQAGGAVPALRAVERGETRVLGTFTRVECLPGVVVLQVDAASGPVRMAVPRFDEVAFLSYRSDARADVRCGAQQPVFPVLATFRAGAPPLPGAATRNRAVAIEVLPEGFTLP